MAHDLWSTLNDKMFEYLSSVKLSELVDAQRHRMGDKVAVIQDRRRTSNRSRNKAVALSS